MEFNDNRSMVHVWWYEVQIYCWLDVFGKLLLYIALNGSKKMLDLFIGHGFDVEVTTEVAVLEV